MKNLRRFALCVVLSLTSTGYGASAAHSFLRYVYGADGIDLPKIAWPHDDIWMLRGAKNPAGLTQLESEKLPHGSNEVLWKNIQNGLCMVEVREGKVDPAFMLEQVYTLHRQLILQFIFGSLSQDAETLGRVTTNPNNVAFGGTKAAARGDMDVYADVISLIPILRVTTPTADKASQSVAYRVPLGKEGFTVTLVKNGSNWLIRTDTKTEVPLAFFFQ
jgi:hypothetical protein